MPRPRLTGLPAGAYLGPMASPTSPSATARLIHLVLLGGIALFTIILAVVPPPSPDGQQASLLLYATFAVAAVMFSGAMFLATRLPAAGPEPDRWWQENLSRALVVWSMLEGPALLGGVVYYLTRNLQSLVVTAVGLLLLGLHGPGRLGRG